jgi:hypothetical protein
MIYVFLIVAILGVFPMNISANDYLEISAVGDIMMGTTYPEVTLPPDDGKGLFDKVKDEFKGIDIVFGNLEGPLIDEGKTDKCEGSTIGQCYAFKTPVRYVQYLKDSGFNVLSIANNHSLDFGLEGVDNTINILNSMDIKPIGGKSIAYLEIKGKRIAIVGFSFSSSLYSYSILDVTEAIKIISMLKETSDIVIVSFHGGSEGKSAIHISDREEIFLDEKRGNVIKFSRSVIDAGADMVIGHGPHVLRALEVYKGKLIAYSLGNFLTYGMFNIERPNGLSIILKAKIDVKTGDFVEGEIVPVKLLNKGIPEIDHNEEAIDLIKTLTVQDITNSNLKIANNGRLILRNKMKIVKKVAQTLK